MKKILLLIAFVVLGTTAVSGQERDQDRIQDQDRTNLVMINGQMLELRDRAHVRLNEPFTLNDGTEINSNGIYITKDGKQLRLRNGECLDSDGIKYRNEYQYRYKVMQDNKGLTQAQKRERNQNRVHYMLVEGEMLQIRNQSQNRLEKQFNLADGSVVNPDGTYLTKDRKQMRLRDGECLNMNGKRYTNMYNHRTMIAKKKMKANKNMIKKKALKKPVIQKKKGKIGA